MLKQLDFIQLTLPETGFIVFSAVGQLLIEWATNENQVFYFV